MVFDLHIYSLYYRIINVVRYPSYVNRKIGSVKHAVRRIVSSEPDHELTENERSQLESAIAAFEKVALPFAPHEVADSCRHSEIQPAIDKYHITLPSEISTMVENQ